MSAEATIAHSEASSRVELERVRHEEEYREHLLHDPKPQEEMNQMVLKSMLTTDRKYWVVVLILAAIAGVGFIGGWLYQIRWGMGVAGRKRPSVAPSSGGQGNTISREHHT